MRDPDDEPLSRPETDAAAEARWRLLWPSTPWDDPADDGDDTSSDREGARPLVPSVSSRPAWWQGALSFGREHVVVVVVALAVGLVFAVMTFISSRPAEVPLPASVSASVASSDAPTPSAEPSPVALIKVHVMGAVIRPGVVTLPDGARVEDALEAAGGLTADADPAQLNLAAVVADGSQIIIGTKQHPLGQVNGGTGGPAPVGASSTTTKVNINTASQVELETLPGVGPVTAQKIITWREQHGRFTKIAELQEIDGIGPKTMAQLEPYVCV